MKRLLWGLSVFFALFALLIAWWSHQVKDSEIERGSGTVTQLEVREGEVDVNGQKTAAAGDRYIATHEGLSTPVPETKRTESPTPIPDSIPNAASQTVLAASGNVLPATQDDYWITGFVRDENRKPLVGSAVTVGDVTRNGNFYSTGTRFERKTKSNEEGYYAFAVVGPGEYSLDSVPPEDYFYIHEKNVKLTEEEKTASADFTHGIAGLSIHGKVIEKETGDPIAGAMIWVSPDSLNHDNKPGQHFMRAKTGVDGYFKVPRLAEGMFSIEVEAKGYLKFTPRQINHPLANFKLTEESAKQEITIELEKGYAAKILVLDPEGKPVPGAMMRVFSDKPGFVEFYSFTDERGVYLYQMFPEGKALAIASKEPYGETLSDVFTPGPVDKPTEVTITLTEPASVSGHVVNQNDEPVKDSKLRADNLTIREKIGRKVFDDNITIVETNESGEYEFKYLGEGTYQINVRDSSGRSIASETVKTTAGQRVTGVDFKIDDDGEIFEINGMVLDQSDKPVAGAFVRAFTNKVVQLGSGSSTISKSNGDSTTNDAGEFHISGLVKADEISLNVTAQGYKKYIEWFDEPKDFFLVKMEANGGVRGIVIDKTSREPVAGVEVRLLGVYVTLKNQTKKSAEDGSFIFEDVAAGRYSLQVESENYSKTDAMRIDVPAGETLEDIVVEIEPGFELKGIVVDSNQNPIENAVLGLHSKMENSNVRSLDSFKPVSFRDSVVSAADGSFQIKGIPPQGDYLSVQHERYAPKSLRVTAVQANAGPLTIVLTPGGSIEGTVYDSDGNPQAGITINAFNYPENLYTKNAGTDENGAYRIDGLPAQAFTVLKVGMLNRDVDQEYKRAVVEEGKTARVDFGGSEGAVVQGTIFRDGVPVPGAYAALKNGDLFSEDARLFTESGPDGSYRFKSVPSGDYTILVSASDKAKSNSLDISNAEIIRRIAVTESQKEYTLDIHIQSYPIMGTVVDAESKAPLEGVRIGMPYTLSSLDIPISGLAETMTDENGAFTTEAREPGHFPLAASKDGYTTEIFTVDVISPQAPGEIPPPIEVNVSLKKQSTEIHVHLSYRGQPFTSGNVYGIAVRDNLGFSFENLVNEPDRPGTFIIKGLFPGNWKLMFSQAGDQGWLYAFASLVNVIEGRSLDLPLEMIETVRYYFVFQPDDGKAVKGNLRVEVDRYPQLSQYPTGTPNAWVGFDMQLPLGRFPVRFYIDGYKQVECIPADMISSDAEWRGYVVNLPLERLGR